MSGWRGLGGNREVPPVDLLGGAEANLVEERGTWGKHGFPHGREPEASDGHSSIESIAQGAKEGSGPPVKAAAIWLQSGWWPTTTTVSPRSAAAALTDSAVAPGASRSSGSA